VSTLDSGHLYYPALSAPLGAEDELVCPKPHEEFVRAQLDAYAEFDLLVIGYSGNECRGREAAARRTGPRALTARRERERSGRLQDRPQARAGALPSQIEIDGTGFTGFAQGPGLDKFLARLSR
jgi:hypothetical protein